MKARQRAFLYCRTIQGECMIARHLKSLSASVGKPRRSWVAVPGFVVLAALLLAGCGGSSSSSSAQGTPNSQAAATSTVTCNASDRDNWHLVTPNVLTIASDTTYAPAEYADPNNPSHFLGYDMDLIREIARRMCVVPDIHTETFGAIIGLLTNPQLGKQKYDLSISSFTISGHQHDSSNVDFIPYFIAGESTLVKKGNPAHVTKVSDMCGKVVSAQTGTIELAELEALNGQTVDPNTEGVPQQPLCKSNQIKILNFDSEEQVVQQVINSRADASYQDQPVTDYYISLHASDLDHGFITDNSQGTEGIAVRKDNAAFNSAVKTALNNMVADGTYKRIMQAWGQTALACLLNATGCPPAS
jgi:polar amino acid transport system substrate-binding protein